MKQFWSACGLALLFGCCSPSRNLRPIADFKLKHLEKFGKYAYFNRISFSTYLAVGGEKAGAVSYIQDETERRFGEAPVVNEVVKWMPEHEREDRRRMLAFVRELEAATSGGCSIC